MYHHTATESLHRLRGAKVSWTSTLAGVSYQFGLIWFSICLQCKITGSSIFSIFLPHNVSHHNVKKVWSQLFKKTSDRLGLEDLKSPKVRFLGFWQKSYPFRYAFLIQHESVNVVLTFCKNNMFAKNLVFDLWSKNLKTNQNAGFFKLQYLTKTWGMKLNFSIWLEVKKALNISWLLQVNVLRHDRTAQSDNK